MISRSGDRPRYAVGVLDVARTEFLDILARAEAHGVGGAVVAAYRAILSQLAADPSEFGEPLYDLRTMQMQARHGSVDALYVEYGVHATQPLVMIRRFAWLGRR